jgi:hypothetical protein
MTFQQFIDGVNRAFEGSENPGWDKKQVLLEALREYRYDLWIIIAGQDFEVSNLMPFLQSKW